MRLAKVARTGMEHRLYVRELVDMQAKLHGIRLGFVTGRIRDMSPAGVFFATESACPLRHNYVEVECSGLALFGHRAVRLRAVVVHVRADGVGLMIKDD